jgi:hypothetical protein
MLACSTNRQIKQVASVELSICRFASHWEFFSDNFIIIITIIRFEV